MTNGHLVQLQHGHLFTRNAVTFGHGVNMFHSRTGLPGDFFGNGIACRVRCRPLAGLLETDLADAPFHLMGQGTG